ncbi:MAG: hypothetical protein JW915_12405 [Chitinispirillaceae bacterium]|nr:hypothetical protein [Chitinispirillaceae bacterium]
MDSVSFLLGILAGGVVASLIWIIVRMVIDSKEKSMINERNPYIVSIGEYVSEADSLLLSYSMGSVSKERLKSEIARLIDTIRKLYKPNLHLFEVFFVKYIETLLNYYASYIKESFSVQSVREEPVYREPKTVSIGRDEVLGASVAAPAIPATVVKSEPPNSVNPGNAALAQSMFGSEDEEEISDIMRLADPVPEKTKPVDNDEEEEFSLEPVSVSHLEVLPVEDADIPVFTPQDQVSAGDAADLQKEESAVIASASTPQEQESEFSFEEMTKDVLTVDEDNEAGFSSIVNKPLDDQKKQIKGVDSDDGDFSMETIMDLDMTKIPNFHSETAKITIRPQSLKPAQSTEEEDSEISFEPQKPQFSSQETKKIPPQSVSGLSPSADGEIKTPASFSKQKAELSAQLSQNDIKPQVIQKSPLITDRIIPEKNQSNPDREQYSITGDDVADQIDSFFGFDKE